jgi:hypothetical protein
MGFAGKPSARINVTYLVCGERREQIRIIGECFNLDTSAVYIDSQQLRTVSTEGDLLHTIRVDESQKV